MMLDEGLKLRLLACRNDSKTEPLKIRLRPSTVALARSVQMVRTTDDSERMASDITRMPVAFLGIDAEFRHGEPSDLPGEWQDLSQLKPISVGVVPFVRAPDGLRAVRYAIDVRRSGVHAGLARVISQPGIKLVSHFFKSELHALKAIGIDWPANFFCTWTAARLMTLGVHHKKYENPAPEDDIAEIIADEMAHKKKQSEASLLGLCAKYGVRYEFKGDKEAMRRRYLRLRDEEDLTLEDGEYVTADAHAAGALHIPMRLDLTEKGLDYHYDQIELPADTELAEQEWHGVKVDVVRIDRAAAAMQGVQTNVDSHLAGFGFRVEPGATGEPPRVMSRSFDERVRVLRQLGVLHYFKSRRAKRGYSFRRKELERRRNVHPAIEALFVRSKIEAVLKDGLFNREYIGIDGRVHPWINPLGAESGRPSFQRGNLVGIPQTMRPVVVADGPGLGIAELDFVAQEPLIAAVVFNDQNLLYDCNGGDVYCQMIRRFCADKLEPGDAALTDAALKKKYRELRGVVKILTLAVLYGAGDDFIHVQAKVSMAEARRLRAAFFERYHAVRDGIERARRQLIQRGYVETITGLKRYRRDNGVLSPWESRWAVNHMVQGGAACILKLLLPRLARFLRRHGGRIVLPIYDAVLVQFPLEKRRFVLECAEQLMKDAFVELYPGANPRIDVNDKDVTCWNKDGASDSIDRLLENPDFKL